MISTSVQYWTTIELTPRESRKYRKIAGKLSVIRYGVDNDPLFTKVLASSRYSLDLKRKLVFHLPIVKQARAWGAQNLEGKDLYEFVTLLTATHVTQPSMLDADNLISNPAFVSSLSKQHDALTWLLVSLQMGGTSDRLLVDYLVKSIIQKKLMTLDIAELIIEVKKIKFAYSELPYQLKVLAAWAREEYDFDEAIPDEWVIKFLTEETGVK